MEPIHAIYTSSAINASCFTTIVYVDFTVFACNTWKHQLELFTVEKINKTAKQEDRKTHNLVFSTKTMNK